MRYVIASGFLAAAALADADPAAHSINPRACALVRTFEPGGEYMVTALVTPDGRWLASGRRDGQVRVLDYATAKERASLTGHADYVHALACSPDSKLLASGGRDGRVRLWSTESWRPVGSLRTSETAVQALAFHPGGERLAVGAADALEIWNLRPEQPLKRVPGVSVFAVQFTRDGRYLAAACASGEVLICDDRVRRLRAHEGYALGLAVHPSRALVASCGLDKKIVLISLPEGRIVGSISADVGIPSSLVFTGDGGYLVWSGREGIEIYGLGVRAVVRKIKTSAGIYWLHCDHGRGSIVAVGGDNVVRVYGAVREGTPRAEPTVNRKTGFFGVYLETAENNGGARITDIIEGCQSARFGAKVDDVIVAMDDVDIKTSEDMITYTKTRKEGDEVVMKIKRGDETLVWRVRLGPRQDE